MAGPLLYDRVLETTTTTGTGTLTLAGAVTGHQSFAAVGDGNTCPFVVYEVDGDGNPDGDWEVSIGAYTASGTTLARTTVLASSNSNNAVNFGAGTKRVALALPAAFAAQYLHPTAAYASLAAAQAGRVLFPSDGFSLLRDTGSALTPWGPLFQFTPPVSGDFSWANEDVATITVAGGGIFLKTTRNYGGYIISARVKSVPSTPYTVSAAFLPLLGKAALSVCGLCWRQSSDGKFIRLGYSTDSGQIIIEKFDDYQTYSAAYLTISSSFPVKNAPVSWVRLADDGTNRKVSLSADGQNWFEIHSVGRTDYMTADQIGFFVDGRTVWSAMTLLSWKEA